MSASRKEQSHERIVDAAAPPDPRAGDSGGGGAGRIGPRVHWAAVVPWVLIGDELVVSYLF